VVTLPRRIICEVTYPDGRTNLSARINVDDEQLKLAQKSHGNARAIENAQKHVAMQFKSAARSKYGRAPRWIDFDKLSIQEVATTKPATERRTVKQAAQQPKPKEVKSVHQQDPLF